MNRFCAGRPNRFAHIHVPDPPLARTPMPPDPLEIPYPAGFEEAVHLTKSEMALHIRLMAALKMFELGKLSAGKAAELAGLSRPEFYEACARYRISAFNYPPEDLEREIHRDLESLRNAEDA